MLSTPLVSAELATYGTAITNGGDNGTAAYVDGINQPGDVVLSYNGRKITCLPTTFNVGQVHEINMTNTTTSLHEIPAGSPAYYHYQVTNTGNGADDIHLSASLKGNGTWTASLVGNQQDAALILPLHINPNQTQSFYLKVMPPLGAVLGSCTVEVTAADAYFHAHAAGDGWPQGQDADVRLDMVGINIIPPPGQLVEEEHGGEVKSQDKTAEVIIPPDVLPVDSYVNI
ncbi:MAG: hypothetical protein AAB296_02830, partial [Candidatus Desantisbacteria bacterium]